MKYRIKQVGDKFYPQVKKALFYHNIVDYYVNINFGSWSAGAVPFKRSIKRHNCPGAVELVENTYYFNSREDAEKYINDYKVRMVPRSYRGHKIFVTKDWYYVDVTCNVYRLDCIGTIVYDLYSGPEKGQRALYDLQKLIDGFEKQWEASKIRKIYKID